MQLDRDYQRPEALDLAQDLPVLRRITRAHTLWGACRRAGWNADDWSWLSATDN